MTSLTAPKSISDDASPLLTQLSLHDLSPSVSSSLPSASDGTLSPERGVPPVRPPKSPSRRSSSQDVKANGSELDKATARDPAYVMCTYESRQTLIGLQKDAGESRRLVSKQIQEFRHSTSASSSSQPLASTTTITTSPIDAPIVDFNSTIASLGPRITAVCAESAENDVAVQDAVQELKMDWQRVSEQHTMLKQEMKEDGWLVRFRTTADQAEAMMDPLTNSLLDVLRFVERITASLVVIPFEAEIEDQPSISQLQMFAKGHESLKGTYVPSINKILKMMGRSISDRSTKNGEALRRFGEMQNRWIGLQRQLRQLDAKIRLIMSQYHTSPMSPTVLTTPLSPYEPIPSEYFGLSKLAQEDDKRTNGSHRSSISSGYSAASADFLRSPANRPPANRPPANRPPANRQHAATLSPDMRPQSLRRRPSMASVKSSATARTDDRPPWNISTKPEYEAQKTPTNARLTSYGSRLPREGSASPTPSNPSISGSIKSRPSAAGSRIPVTSPKSKLAHTAQKQMDVPAFAVSTSHGQSFLSEDPHAGNHLVHTRQAMRTPQASRSRPSATYSAMQPRASLTPSIGQRSFSSGATPRTAPNPRKNLSYAPPSSFRPTMSTPGWTSLRPSSRMSVASYSNFDAANLQPFQPSKYDLLDQHVHSAIEEVGFDLFAGRVDLPLRKGQRKRDDEEWKGEFVFGAGEKPVGVKLLELAGRSTSGGSEGPRMKCLARTGGAWGDLAGLLMKRKAEAPRAMLDSP